MQIRGVDLISYRVTDLDRSISFYRDTLGLEQRTEPSGHWVEFSLPPTTLALFKAENIPYEEADYGAFKPGSTMVFLAVDNVKNALKELEEAGVEVAHGYFEAPGCCNATIKDPDGNLIHLHQRKNGSFG